jgi:UDP-2,3-diacylglucosamine hydrolase
MPSYLISDLHLSPERPAIAAALERFLTKIAFDAKTIYILGDFFDAWIGDDEDEAFYLEIQTRLRAVVDRGVDVYFQHGNRDFLVAEAFATATGTKLLDEETVVTLAGQRVLLMHGDSLCTDDQEYQQFRQQVRSPAWQAQILQLPLAQRRMMAQQLRAQSSSMNAMKAEDIMDVNAEAVAAALSRNDVKTLIHGHTHRPAIHRPACDSSNLPTASCRYVLGDWEQKGWYLKADNERLELVDFEIEM